MHNSDYKCPKQHMKNTQNFVEYQCNMCLQICVKPTLCKGKCKKMFCMKCVSEWRVQRDQCPLRCSSPFEVKILPELEIQFSCPYNAEKCQIIITSVNQFNQHFKICAFVPQSQIQAQKLKKQFKCPNAHLLEFYIGSYEEMCNSVCSLCNYKKLCRAICRKCQNELYCVNCRPPPCRQGKCPTGHEMELMKSANLGYICDICGISTAISNNSVYDDRQCNFGICEDCYDTMGKKQQEQKKAGELFEIEVQTNNNDQCGQGHKLAMIQAKSLMKNCSNCSKYKACPKECLICCKNFCIICKNIAINGDETCEYGHVFEHMSPGMIQGSGINTQESICMRCSTSSNATGSWCYDKFCKILLCNQCLIYEVMICAEKERFIEQLRCKKGHFLRYMNNPQHKTGYCNLCIRKMPAKLLCDFCEEKDRIYCCACRPLQNFSTCYFGHELKKIEYTTVEQKRQVCALCIKKDENISGCRKCSFYVCQDCQFQFGPNSYLQQESWMVDESEQPDYQSEIIKNEKKEI